MTPEQYNKRLKEIYESKRKEEEYLMKQYVNSNNPYAVGDVVTDHIGSIKIEKIGFYWSEPPCATYYGVELKKDITPKKNGNKRTVYQRNLIIKS